MTERLYKIDFSPDCRESCGYCREIGNKPRVGKSPTQLEESLKKAIQGGYSGVLLPCNIFYGADFQEVLCSIRGRFEQSWIQLNSRYFGANWKKELKAVKESGLGVHLLVDGERAPLSEQIQLLKDHQIEFKIHLVVSREHLISRSMEAIPESHYEAIRFIFPMGESQPFNFLTTTEIYQFVKNWNRTFPQMNVRPPEGLEAFDSRICEESNLEPFIQPTFSSEYKESGDIKISVIIPSYNNKDYLTNVVRHLSRQKISPRAFEIIVVDDGSTDGTEQELKKQMFGENKKINFKYIFFPRGQNRKMGDGNFRAGIARNLGVKHAQGGYLCFLDSDILVPPNFISELVSQLQVSNVVQGIRYDLKQGASSRETQWSELEVGKDTFVPEGGYWQNFYQSQTPWMQMGFPWKYVCTYCLAMKKKDFQESGWFKKNYHYYGFEDTDLGFRLFRRGLSFELLRLDLFHLYHSGTKSEFFNSQIARNIVLSKTAKIFFFNHLDTKIYEALRGLVSSRFSFRYWVNRMKRIFRRQKWEI